jgi:hypothetical protein
MDDPSLEYKVGERGMNMCPKTFFFEFVFDQLVN